MELNARQQIFVDQHQDLIRLLQTFCNTLPCPVLADMIEINQIIIELSNFLTKNYPDLSQQLQRPEIVNLDSIYSSISVYSSKLFEYYKDNNYPERQIIYSKLILCIPEDRIAKWAERITAYNLRENSENARQNLPGRN